MFAVRMTHIWLGGGLNGKSKLSKLSFPQKSNKAINALEAIVFILIATDILS